MNVLANNVVYPVTDMFYKTNGQLFPIAHKFIVKDDGMEPFEWIARKDATKGDWSWFGSITYGNSLFVATIARANNDEDRLHMIWTSPNGIEWDIQSTPTAVPPSGPWGHTQTWRQVIYGNGMFVAIGDTSMNLYTDDQSMIMTSTDGISWTLRDMPFIMRPTDSRPMRPRPVKIVYGNGIFLIITLDNATIVSNDGINWVQADNRYYGQWSALCYGNGLFVAATMPYSEYYESSLLTSTNGVDWTEQNVPAPPTANSGWRSYGFDNIIYGNGLFVAVSRWSPVNAAKTPQYAVVTSSDGINWTVQETPQSGNDWDPIKWVAAACADGLFVALSNNEMPPQQCMISYDGINWELKTTVYSDRPSWGHDWHSWADIAYGDDKFVAVGAYGMNPYDIGLMTLAWK